MKRIAPILLVVLAGVALAQETTTFQETILPSILAAVGTLLGGVLTWAAARAAAWMNLKASETKNAMLRSSLMLVADIAGTAVQHVAQTAVDKIKAASADGRLTPRDAADALKAAVLETWEGIGDQARGVLLAEFGSVDEVINKILTPAVEAKVRESKVTTPVSAIPVVPEKAEDELRLARERLMSLGSM